MVFHFFTAFFVYIRFHGNWPNDRLLPVSTSFRGMLPVVMGRPFGGPSAPLTEEVYTFIIN